MLDQATVARTIAEPEAEIATLGRLEDQTRELRRSGQNRNWAELDTILDYPLMTDPAGNRVS